MSHQLTFALPRIARFLAACSAFSILTCIVSCKKDEGDTNTSADDNTPPPIMSVNIGSQEWMAKNLNVATYRDGTPIPQVTDPTQWANLATGAWCWYNNDSANYASTYGRLYNWYAIKGIYDAASESNPILRKQLAPGGWHVPSDDEWSAMINFLDPMADGGSNTPNTAGNKMRSTGTIEDGTGLWHAVNVASNASSFTGLPGGARAGAALCDGICSYGFWWSSSESDANLAWFRCLDIYYINRNIVDKQYGMSVRCIKD